MANCCCRLSTHATFPAQNKIWFHSVCKVTLVKDTKMPPPKIIAEYAKSARSACKKCGNNIDKGLARLGSVSKGPGGYDVTRWYHVACFPPQSDAVSTDVISGFSSLQASDQESIKAVTEDLKPQKPSDAHTKVSKRKSKGHEKTEQIESDERFSKSLKTGDSSHEALANDDGLNLNEFSASDLKTTYKDGILPPNWKAFRNVIILDQEELKASEKVAAFDFDGCLAKTSVKKVGANAWSLQYSSIPQKLQSYHEDGFKLVIFTNESNIERWKNSRQKAIDSKLGRLEAFIKQVKLPIQVFVACGVEGTGDCFRKPKPGMWWLMEKHFNSGVAINKEKSFYVGDAAGREKDHSDSDTGFAKAVGLKFMLPEDVFVSAA